MDDATCPDTNQRALDLGIPSNSRVLAFLFSDIINQLLRYFHYMPILHTDPPAFKRMYISIASAINLGLTFLLVQPQVEKSTPGV